ncbi:MAG: PEGA domain-containing protein [Methanoregulaceae archaeon]|nr:PEGA domain-containing protein [Methanoregulaceae archaeon]
MKKNHLFILLSVICLTCGGYLLASQFSAGPGFPLDDAWIHQTYARNLVKIGQWAFIPGIPSAGSRMDSSVSPVVSGNPDTFTQVPVDYGYWNYSWNTARVSGGLAEGEYTIYAAPEPVSARDLSVVPYSDLLITLYRPPTTGGLSVLSSPSSAQVSLNGRYAGDTPLNLSSLSPGEYMIEVAREGYFPVNETMAITAGDRKVVQVVLLPVPPETTVTILPVTTQTAALETSSPVPTTHTPFPHMAVVLGLLLGVRFCRVRE